MSCSTYDEQADSHSLRVSIDSGALQVGDGDVCCDLCLVCCLRCDRVRDMSEIQALQKEIDELEVKLERVIARESFTEAYELEVQIGKLMDRIEWLEMQDD